MCALGLLLQVTLHVGPESVQTRVYLSPATLLVVPATLIGHWREQVLDLLCSVLPLCPYTASLILLFNGGKCASWMDVDLCVQIAMHTAEGALRVRVLDKTADGQEHTALDTAWHHDLVITTFQRLSVEWGKGRKNVRSLFSQVRLPIPVLVSQRPARRPSEVPSHNSPVPLACRCTGCV